MTLTTDLKDLLLTHNAKKNEFSRLLAEIDHEWKQPLNTISLLSSSLLTLYSDDRLNEEVLLDLQNRFTAQINFLNDTIANYRKFYTPSDSSSDFNVLSTINTSLKLINYLIVKQQIQVKVTGDAELSIFGPASDFQQIIISLIDGSRQVFENKSVTDKQVTINFEKKGEDRILINYQDNSGAMTEDEMKTLFQESTQPREITSSRMEYYLVRAIIIEIYGGDIVASPTSQGINYQIEMNIKSQT